MENTFFNQNTTTEQTPRKRYNCLVVDAVNLAYKVFVNKTEKPSIINRKAVYKESICNFINTIEDLKNKYLYDDGEVFILFDNYFSKADMQSAFMFADRRSLLESYKKARSKEEKEFYNSLNLIRYYYTIGKKGYYTVRIDGLEADDLVDPLLNNLLKDKSCLLVSSDLDWTRSLRDNVDWLNKLNEYPKNILYLSQHLGFDVNRKNIILYKAIFGDPSDNIPSIVPMNDKNLNEFCDIIKDIDYLDGVFQVIRGRHRGADSSLASSLESKESQLRINIQIVDTIPIDWNKYKEFIIEGRYEKTMYDLVREVVGLEVKKKPFVFGNVKRPRV